MPLTPHDHPAPVTRRDPSILIPVAVACAAVFAAIAWVETWPEPDPGPPPIPRASAPAPPIPGDWPDRLDPALWPAIHRRVPDAAPAPVNERPPDDAPEPALAPVPGTLPSAVGPPPGIDLTGLAMHALARLSEVEARITRLERRLDGALSSPHPGQETPVAGNAAGFAPDPSNPRHGPPAASQDDPTNGGGIAETPDGGPQS